jgi:hypothetical protein
MTAPPSSLFPGSILIELNHFNLGPSLVTKKKKKKKKAQGKKHSTNPSKTSLSPIKLTNFSNSFLSPAKNIPTTHISSSPVFNIQPKPTCQQAKNHETPSYLSKNLKTHLKKKRHRNIGPSNPHKKGSATPYFDLMLSNDMDTSNLTETQAYLPYDSPSQTPPHFFKAARKGKKVATHASSS